MRVRATVVSRPTDTRAVIDCGTKVLTSDLYTVTGYGHVVEYPEAVIPHLSEEHGVIDLSKCRERPAVGDVVHVVPNHCCVVSNMVDEVYGVRGGRSRGVAGRRARHGALRDRWSEVRRLIAPCLYGVIKGTCDSEPDEAMTQPPSPRVKAASSQSPVASSCRRM